MAETRHSLEALELLVVQDIFPCVTARELAHVVLPSACAFEKDGTFMNAERRVQRVRKILDPPGDARPDWVALCRVARAMERGAGFAFETAEQIWDEVRDVWPGARGMSYARLDERGLQWPCPDERHPGTRLLHAGSFASGVKARLRCIEYAPTPEQTSSEFPFVLGTGRSLYQFNAGTMTRRTRNEVLRPSDRLDISPEDAAKLGIVEGQHVHIQSRYGRAMLPAHLDDAVDAGQLFATFSDPATAVNALTGPYLDAHTETPEYKVTAVRIEGAQG
jgi:formate dehydrogenase major subunit